MTRENLTHRLQRPLMPYMWLDTAMECCGRVARCKLKDVVYDRIILPLTHSHMSVKFVAEGRLR